MNYASFWQRFAAGIIDGVILFLLMSPFTFGASSSKTMTVVTTVVLAALANAYDICLHRRFGATIGKKLMRIRVVRLDGSPIAWREAWLRISVAMAFSFLDIASQFIALSRIADDQFYGATWTEQSARVYALRPGWLAWSSTAGGIWMLSEVFVALTNKRRRALHDFIAGTVVISEKSASNPEEVNSPRAERETTS
jgi:uncharacterized RDD family membrane protein YckC